MAQAAPDIGARRGSRWRGPRAAQQRGRGETCGLARLGTVLAALPRRHGANHGRDRSQQVGYSHSELAERDHGHSYSPDRCMLTVRTQVDSRATRWWLHALSFLDKVIYVDVETLTEEERWL